MSHILELYFLHVLFDLFLLQYKMYFQAKFSGSNIYFFHNMFEILMF